MENLTMQSPWVCYSNKIREMFKRDPEIKMTWSDETLVLKMYVANDKKAEALNEILPDHKVFGKNIVKIEIIPANDCDPDGLATYYGPTTYDRAFAGNPIFHYTKTFKDAFMGHPVTYVVFAKEVLQWYNDDLNDLFGNANMLAEDVARDILKDVDHPGTICFCTDVE